MCIRQNEEDIFNCQWIRLIIISVILLTPQMSVSWQLQYSQIENNKWH